ncbi:other/FunK1 protein kinase [Coprinopsis cinerea AmutBmut pab1-1]|nr:other/FunK1 protein kinase [Coprinopsis cinerea AmutBmut pab1-1]
MVPALLNTAAMTSYDDTLPNFETPQYTPFRRVTKEITTYTPPEPRIIAVPEAKTTAIGLDIGKDMNKQTSVCDIEVFMDHYLPKVDDEVFGAVLDDLKKRGTLVPRDICATDAATARVATLDTTNLGRAICKALEKAGIKPNAHIIRMFRDNQLKSPINGSIRNTDVAVAFEFKSTRVLEMEDPIHVALQASDAINDDARRKFVLGITIEDDHVSLWYFSRTNSAKSMSFSIVERADLYVKIMISLFCATDEQLGFDPLVQLIDDHLLSPSDEMAEAKYYRTKNSVSASRSVGRAGRFSRARQVELVDTANESGEKDMILNDVLSMVDAPAEVDIPKLVLADIEGLRKDSEQPLYDAPLMGALSEADSAFLTSLLQGAESGFCIGL